MSDDFVDIDLDLEGDSFVAETSAPTGATRTASRANASATGQLKMAAANRVRGLAGRMGLGNGSSAPGVANGRLSSVVNESTPGPALELLRANTAFALPGQEAWVMLVLPTTGDFGGLSQQTSDEAKGQFIQRLHAEAIDAIVTADLLTDDALGLVPNTKSMQVMSEFEILSNARYVYAVACTDKNLGDLRIFVVPPVSLDGVTNRVDGTGDTSARMFEKIRAVTNGQAELSTLIDPKVAEAMLAVYRCEDYGDAELDEAVAANMNLIVEAVARDSYPTTAQFVHNLSQAFPKAEIGTVGSSGKHRAAGAPPTAEAMVAAGLQDAAQAAQDTERAQPPVPPENLAYSQAGNVIEEGESYPAAASETVDEVSDPEPDFSDSDAEQPRPDPAEPDFGGGPAAPAPGSMDMAVLAAIESLRDEVARSSQTAGGLPTAPSHEPVPVDVEPGSEFTYEQALRSAGRRYINDDLGLFVDIAPFNERLTWAPPRLEVPTSGVTEWLGDQVEVLVAALREQINTNHETTIASLRRQYLRLADAAAADTNVLFDPQRNPDSEWGRSFAALESDKRLLNERLSDTVLKAEKAVYEHWANRRTNYVNDAAARAGQEFDAQYGTRIKADATQAGEDVLAGGEALYEHNLAEFQQMRRSRAQQYMDVAISDILAQLDKEAEKAQRDDESMVAVALATINDYLDKHRQEDLDQAAVNARMLATDTRLEQAAQEATRRIEEIQQEASTRIANMQADADRRTAETQRQIELTSQTSRMEVSNQQARVQSLQGRLNDQTEQYEAAKRSLSESAQDQIRVAQARADAAERDKSLYISDKERRNTYQLVLSLLLIVVVGVVAFLAGAALLGR